jgi:hypothetical protein
MRHAPFTQVFLELIREVRGSVVAERPRPMLYANLIYARKREHLIERLETHFPNRDQNGT